MNESISLLWGWGTFVGVTILMKVGNSLVPSLGWHLGGWIAPFGGVVSLVTMLDHGIGCESECFVRWLSLVTIA